MGSSVKGSPGPTFIWGRASGSQVAAFASTQKLDFGGEKWEAGTARCCSGGKDNGSLIPLPEQSPGMYLLIISPFSSSLSGLELEGQMRSLGRFPAPCSPA